MCCWVEKSNREVGARGSEIVGQTREKERRERKEMIKHKAVECKGEKSKAEPEKGGERLKNGPEASAGEERREEEERPREIKWGASINFHPFN